MSDILTDLLTKFVDEADTFNWDFTKNLQLKGGAVIVSATVTQTFGDSALVIGTPVINSPIVQAKLSGGTAEMTYHLICDATLNNGNVISLCGRLLVEAC
jgi:hypothetical protein